MNVRTFYGKKKVKTVTAPTLNELLDNITTRSFSSADVFITPPGDESDGDSDKSDTEKGSDYIADHLTSKILNAPAEATIDAEDSEDSNGEEEDSVAVPEGSNISRAAAKKRKISKTVEKWKKGDLKPQHVDGLSTVSQQCDHTKNTPTDLFEMFWPIEFFEYIKNQSELYARQCNATSMFEVTVEELKLFFTVLMISGYSSLPRRDLYWSNRVENCPLVGRQFDKERRGSVNSYVNHATSKLVIVQWKDNAVVRMASNCFGVAPTRSARRWSSADKKHITVDMPYAISMYNSFMGGTDQMDRNVSEYRVKLRNNKWWWQVFTHLMSASLSNAWILYRRQIRSGRATAAEKADSNFDDEELPKLDFLGFIRSIVANYLLLFSEPQNLGRPSSSANRKAVLMRNIPDSVRLSSNVQHYPDNVKQGRCRVCKKNTTFSCGVCRVNLHPVNCYKDYHK